MKPITTSDINPRFLFILDMYGATERFIENMNIYEQTTDIEILNSKISFYLFATYAFSFYLESTYTNYWWAIAEQNEPEIKRLTKLIKN